MDLAAALRELADALDGPQPARGRDARFAAARQVVAGRCLDELAIAPSGQTSIAAVIRLAASAEAGPARRACAALMVHALATPGLLPAASAADVCALVEGALRDVLLRCAYPFGGSIEDKLHVLQRLHTTLGELMQPLEPTFPNWIQGLHAG